MELYTIPFQDNTPGEKWIIFRPVLGLAFIGNRPMVELARYFANGGQVEGLADSQLEAAAFLQEIDFTRPDPGLPDEPRFTPTTAVLLLTNRCQLRCVYCYAAAGEFPEKELNVTSGNAVIDFVHDFALENHYNRFDVSFHGGGEPTFAWEVLKQCTAHARSKPHKAHLSLTSNAMWSSAQLEWLIDNMDGLGVSMDGSPSTQDAQRPVKSGRPSSPVVLRNIAELDRRGFNYGVRITAIPPFRRLPDDVRFICETMGSNMIQVEPAYNLQRGSLAHPDDDQTVQFANAFSEAREIARAHGKGLHYSGARPDMLTNHFCNSPYTAVIVVPDDRIVACYEVAGSTHPLAEISTLGRVEDGKVVLDPGARQRLHDLLAQRRAACQDCFCYWSCAGDCYTRAFLEGVEKYPWHSQRCTANRILTQDIILTNIEEGNGVWHAPRRQLHQAMQGLSIPE